MEEHLPQAVVADLQQEDLPSPAISQKSNAPRDLLHLDVVNEQSTGNNDVSPKPVAKRIMKRKESRGKRSSSQSSSRAVTPDPGQRRFNPRREGLGALYQCLLRLCSQSSDGTILWNDLRTAYRKETSRHLNSEELNLISGTHNRTKNDLLATKLSCIIEPLDSKGQIVRLAVTSDGSPVPLPSPMTSDDDSGSTRPSLSRLASIDDEEQQRIIMDEKRREITETLIKRGLLNPDGSRSVTITENEEFSDLPELVPDSGNSDVMESKEESEASVTQDNMTNGEKDLISEEIPSAEGIAQVVKMVEGVEPVTTEASLLNSEIKQVTAGVVEKRDEAIGEIQAKVSKVMIEEPEKEEIYPEKKVSMVSVPSIEITQYSDDETEFDKIEEKTASEMAEELVASVLADSVDSMKDDLVVNNEEELVNDVHAVLDDISNGKEEKKELIGEDTLKKVYTLEETAHYLMGSDSDSDDRSKLAEMKFPPLEPETENARRIEKTAVLSHEEEDFPTTEGKASVGFGGDDLLSRSSMEDSQVEKKETVEAVENHTGISGEATKEDVEIKVDDQPIEENKTAVADQEEKNLEEKTLAEEVEIHVEGTKPKTDAVAEDNQALAQKEAESIPVAAPRTIAVSEVETVQEKATTETALLVVEDRAESLSESSTKSMDSVVTVEEAIHKSILSSSESETALPEVVKVEAVIEEKKPEYVPHSVTKTVTFEVLEQRNEKTVTIASQTLINSETLSSVTTTEAKEEEAPTPVYRTESGGTVTLEVELKKLNEEYEELMEMLDNKPHASTSQELPPPKTNKVADVVVTLTPNQDLEKRDYVAQPADQPKKKKEKKRRGLFGCCSFF